MRHHHTPYPYLFALVLGGCSLERFPWIYRLDINQGNIVTQEMVNQLRPGMNRRQVTFIMGSPLLTDPFHDNRWDYLYSVQPAGEPRAEKHLTLVFDRDQLVSLQGDFRPGVTPEVETAKDTTVSIPKIEHEKNLWEKITGLFGDD